ncbi:MAG: GNAT family N-acetyltransferase [Gammaproteobacteria bacterium]|nr:GNAT family N-acetyltransferase [Gammaproteobacteria bacterium]
MNYLIPEKAETERLILRAFKEEDWVDLYQLYSDPECIKFTIQRTLSKGESWRTMATMIGHWQLRGYGPYAMEDKATGKVMGPVGLWYPKDWPEPEIKWALSRAFWGKGYASEAARAVKKIAAECMPDISLISLIFSDNMPSIKLAEAIGARFEKEIEFRGQIAHIFRHSKEEV